MANITVMLKTPLCDHLCLCNMDLMALLVNIVTLSTIQKVIPSYESLHQHEEDIIYISSHFSFVCPSSSDFTNRDAWIQN